MRYNKHTLTLNGEKIAYITTGSPDAPPIMFVHGWLSHKLVWRHALNVMSDRFFCVALDLLGHSDSDRPLDGDYSIAAQGRRVLALVDHLGWQQFDYVGHSMGGQIGLWIALEHPGRIARLVSVSGVVSGRLGWQFLAYMKPIIKLGGRYPSIWKVSRRLFHYTWYATLYDRLIRYRRDCDPMYYTLDRAEALRPGGEVPFARELDAIAAVDHRPRLGELRLPVFGIHGSRDLTVPPRDAYALERGVAGCKLTMLSECGHSPMLERTNDFLDVLEGFLTVPPKSRADTMQAAAP